MLRLRLPIPIDGQHIIGHVDRDYHWHRSAIFPFLLGGFLDPLAVEEGKETGGESCRE
jgi:hypothetical protein